MTNTSDTRQPSTPVPRSHLTARILSFVGHPGILIPCMVAIATRQWTWTAVIVATSVLPMLVVMLRKVRRGEWTNHDVSRHDQRSGVYFVAGPLLLTATLICWLLGAAPALLRGMAAGGAMLACGLILNRWLKVSMHMMFAAYSAVVVVRLHPATAIPIAIFVLAIAWSRLHLRRHTLAEVVVGTLIGSTAALVASLN